MSSEEHKIHTQFTHTIQTHTETHVSTRTLTHAHQHTCFSCHNMAKSIPIRYDTMRKYGVVYVSSEYFTTQDPSRVRADQPRANVPMAMAAVEAAIAINVADIPHHFRLM